MNWPGHIPAGKVNNEPLHMVDWYPTLVKLAGGSLAQKLPPDGRDIWPVLTEGAKSPHESLLLCGTRPPETALRRGDWKLVHRAGGDELYNLAQDIAESHDLAGEQPVRLHEMRAELDKWLKGAVPSGDPSKKPAGEMEE